MDFASDKCIPVGGVHILNLVRAIGWISTQRAHWVSYRPNPVSMKSHFFLSSLSSDYAEGPGRLRTFPASWYTLTGSIHEKEKIRQLWATFFDFFKVGVPEKCS